MTHLIRGHQDKMATQENQVDLVEEALQVHKGFLDPQENQENM